MSIATDLKVLGHLTQEGKSANLNSENLSIRDPTSYINNSYTTTTATSPGFVFNNRAIDPGSNDGTIVDFSIYDTGDPHEHRR